MFHAAQLCTNVIKSHSSCLFFVAFPFPEHHTDSSVCAIITTDSASRDGRYDSAPQRPECVTLLGHLRPTDVRAGWGRRQRGQLGWTLLRYGATHLYRSHLRPDRVLVSIRSHQLPAVSERRHCWPRGCTALDVQCALLAGNDGRLLPGHRCRSGSVLCESSGKLCFKYFFLLFNDSSITNSDSSVQSIEARKKSQTLFNMLYNDTHLHSSF